MEKNTLLSCGTVGKPVRASRVMIAALLVSAVIFLAVPGPMGAQAELQSSYANASFAAGTNPSAAKIGDLDGDRLNDIAVVNLQGSLQLFFNNGAGSFERVSLPGLWPSSSYTLDLEIGDLNGDGRNDLAVAFSTQTGAISVLINQGNRAFAAPVNYNVCSSSSGVAVGDLDKDGDNDLADVNQCFKSGILLNNGQGSFTYNGSYGNGYGSKSIALADFNGDGFKDIAYVNNGLGNVTVLFNNRNGTFAAPIWLYAGDLPDDLTVGDFDGDGNQDIAIANSYFSQIIILFSNGNGSFPGYSEIPVGNTPVSIASADFNGDGRLDFALASWATNTLSILTYLGDYNYSSPRAFNVGQSPVDVAVGNLDGDSTPDLVAVNQGSGSITVLTSAGTVTPPPPPPAQIILAASTRTTRTAKLVDLRWSGATGSAVDIYRNGSRIATVSNTGSYTDRFGSRTRGTFTYSVCVAGSRTCSNEATIRF
ncbi:MAG TPA: VCBS repeat-containing protein [Blastocatellia bacterium]